MFIASCKVTGRGLLFSNRVTFIASAAISGIAAYATPASFNVAGKPDSRISARTLATPSSAVAQPSALATPAYRSGAAGRLNSITCGNSNALDKPCGKWNTLPNGYAKACTAAVLTGPRQNP